MGYNKAGKAGKIILRTVLAVLALVVLILLVFTIMYGSPQYVLRVLIGQDSGVYDYRRFPGRSLNPGDNNGFHFTGNNDEDAVRRLFEADTRIVNLDYFLRDTRTQAFLVIQNDTILYEKYFNGADRESLVTSFSIAKSFTSALIGCAIDDGFIGSIEDPITDYLPELTLKDDGFSKIAIRDLLLMTSGLRFKKTHFLDGDEVRAYYRPDLRKTAIEEAEIISPPEEFFLYNHYHPLLLGMILERVTGMSVTAYLQKKIWTPLGMEYGGSWTMDSRASGFEKMESGINGRAIDFARFGRLFLKQGDWNGTRVLPADWVAESTRPDKALMESVRYPDWFSDGSLQRYYSYMWWGWIRGDDGYDFYAEGDKGQFLYMSPSRNLIIVRHGEKYGTGAWPEIFYEAAGRIELR